jgi:hypothetical protein
MANPLFSDYAPAGMRNPATVGLQQRQALLELDPGPRTIAGGEQGRTDFAVNRPPLNITTLGELRSDADGRLLVVGGMGHAHFDPALPRSDGEPVGGIGDYANNDSWFDDVSDGPVEAEIVIDGQAHQADGAWALVGPPDFAPTVRGYRSMYDTLVDVFVREVPLPPDDGLFAGPLADLAAMKQAFQADGTLKDYRPSFTRHIYPILAAVANMWRVHARRNAPTSNFHRVLDPGGYDLLGGADSDDTAREDIFARMRDPNTLLDGTNRVEPMKMPLILGDYYGFANGRGGPADPAYFHSVSRLQYALLRAWSEGRFERDWTGVPPIAEGPVTPAGLDRAALEHVAGGGFFPGIEASWLLTKAQVYRAPFRIARGSIAGRVPVPVANGQPAQMRDVALEAGAFSQQMALPWQADFLMCRAEERAFPNPAPAPPTTRRIGWWPLQRPDQVFREDSPQTRRIWARHDDADEFGDDYLAMVGKWSSLGFVTGNGADLFETEGPPAHIA